MYIGEDVPQYIEDETTDAFICKRNKIGVDWLQFLLEMISKKSTVLTIYDMKGTIVAITIQQLIFKDACMNILRMFIQP